MTLWSTVIRIPTDGGDVWFKANDDAMRHESGGRRAAGGRGPRARAAPARRRHRARLAADGRRGGVAPHGLAARGSPRPLARGAAGVRRARSWRSCRTSTPCWRSACPTGGCRRCPTAYAAPDGRDRRRAALPCGGRPGRGAGRAAGGVRHRRDAQPRRPARRAGVREGRPRAGHGLGRRLHLAPVLHLVGDPRGRARRGDSTTSRTPSTPRRSWTPTWRRSAAGTTATWPRPPASPCGWAGPAGPSTATCRATRARRSTG